MCQQVLLKGAPGIGKTSFLKHYEKSRRSISPIYWLNLRNESFDTALEYLLKEISASDYTNDFAVFIDDAEMLHGRQIEYIYNRIANYKYCVAVVFSAREFNEVSALSRSREFEIIELNAFSDEESHSLVDKLLKKADHSTDFHRQLISLAKGNPLLLHTLIKTLNTHGQPALEKLIAGEIYKLADKIVLPENEILVAVRPEIVIANCTIIDRLKLEPESIYDLAPRQFEEVLADLLTGMGYETTLTAPSGDGGKDIIAKMNTELGEVLCLVEAKRYRKDRKVGVELVRTLFGTVFDHNASSGMLVTTSSFTSGAKDFQSKHKYRLTLRDYGNVQSWIQNHDK